MQSGYGYGFEYVIEGEKKIVWLGEVRRQRENESVMVGTLFLGNLAWA